MSTTVALRHRSTPSKALTGRPAALWRSARFEATSRGHLRFCVTLLAACARKAGLASKLPPVSTRSTAWQKNTTESWRTMKMTSERGTAPAMTCTYTGLPIGEVATRWPSRDLYPWIFNPTRTGTLQFVTFIFFCL